MNGKFMQKKLSPYVGKRIKVKYSLGRNKYEVYDGTLKELFPNVFLLEDEMGTIKCFSYSDLLTKTVRLKIQDR